MHERFFDFPGFDSDEHIFMAGNPIDAERLSEERKAGRAAAWDKLPPTMAPRSVRALRLFDYHRKQRSIPRSVHALERLTYLSVPAHLLADLDPKALPASVRTLALETGGVVRIPPTAVFRHVERLISAPQWRATGVLIFAPTSFPSLKHLHERLDVSGRVMSLVPQLPHLVELAVGPCSKPSLFRVLEGLRLELLMLVRGTLPTLAGIERISTLTDLRLVRLTRLRDLSPLAKLPNLRELSVLDCPNLTNIAPLLEIPRLERLMLWGCRDNGGAIRKLTPRLEARKLRELLVA